MKIVDRAVFLTLPSGTVFAKFEPYDFGPWEIKGETMGEDYVTQRLDPYFDTAEADWSGQLDVIDSIRRGDASPPLDLDCAGRDGRFDREQLFAVCERADLAAIVSRLTAALAEAYPE